MASETDDMKTPGAVIPQGSDAAEVGSNTPYIDPEKEKRIVRKFDYLVMPQFVIMMLLA